MAFRWQTQAAIGKQVAADARSLDITSMNDLTRRKDYPHCPRRSVTIQHESLPVVYISRLDSIDNLLSQLAR
jgi:hypothetical protein